MTRLPAPPAPAPPSTSSSLTAPHAIYLDAICAELKAAGILPADVTLTTPYRRSRLSALTAEFRWGYETRCLSAKHWPHGSFVVRWNHTAGWHTRDGEQLPLDRVSPPQPTVAAIHHLMRHGDDSVPVDRTVWEHAHLLAAIDRERPTHELGRYLYPRQETPCP